MEFPIENMFLYMQHTNALKHIHEIAILLWYVKLRVHERYFFILAIRHVEDLWKFKSTWYIF